MKWVCVLILALIPPPAASAQSEPGGHEPFVPLDHWSHSTLIRLAGAGVADAGEAMWAWPMSRTRVREILRTAAGASSRAGRVAESALARFQMDFPESTSGALVAAIEVGGGWSAQRRQLLAGSSFPQNVGGSSYSGPIPAPDSDGGLARIRGEASFGRAAASLTVEGHAGARDVTEATLSATVGPLVIWGGRRGISTGSSPDGSIVLSPGVAFDGGGLGTPTGFKLGWLGQVRATVMLARFERSGTVQHPYFSAARVSLTPRPWMTIGLNRATLFGGDGNLERVSPANVLLMLAGVTSYLGKNSGFENQVASLDLWVTRHLGKVPLVLYGEWGIDDIGQAWKRVPGFVFGAQLPALPFASSLALGIEHVRFAGSCCGSPKWYLHRQLGEGWTDRGQPMGHPLGGHGSEWALRFEVLEAGGRFHLGGRAFRRDRGEENLFAPDRFGASKGVLIRSGWRPIGSLEVGTEAGVEQGLGWDSWEIELSMSWWASTARLP